MESKGFFDVHRQFGREIMGPDTHIMWWNVKNSEADGDDSDGTP